MKRLVLAFALAMLVGAALAQDYGTNVRRCTDVSADPDLRIGACTWLLNSGQLSEGSIPITYFNRGNTYRDKR